MSSELERLLRDARERLPGPDDAVTERARRQALASLRRRRPRARIAALVGIALGLTAAFGAGLGAVIAPSGTAARGAVGLGFLPESGWYVLQSGVRASTSSPAVAVASNVPFAADDDVGGAAESSALPYSTLLRLPEHGVVIAVTFTPRGEEPWRDRSFSARKLPLRLPAVIPRGQFGVQLRPEEPLGVYGIDAAVNGHNVDLQVYFGTPQPSAKVIASAQRQLDLLVVRPRAVPTRAPFTAAAPVGGQVAVLDRTYVCATRSSGGINEIDASARAGIGRGPSGWSVNPLAALSTGSDTGAVTTVLDNELAWVSAGRPSSHATIVPDPYPGVTYPVRTWGTVAVNRTFCKPVAKRIPLTGKGLSGGAVTALGDSLDCATPRRVLIRVRAVVQSQTLKQHRSFLRTLDPAREARLAVRTESGKPLVYAEVFQTGKARLFTARGCAPD